MPPSSRPAGKHHGEVLVIDDDRKVGVALGRLLRRYHVTVVESGREALDLIAGGKHFDAILCDLMMPDMNGMDLHAELTRSMPQVVERMIFITGGAFTPSARAFLSRVAIPCLEKPPDVNNLLALIERLTR